MNGRIIKAYLEMVKSQTQHTPLAEAKSNPKIISNKAKRCLGNQDSVIAP